MDCSSVPFLIQDLEICSNFKMRCDTTFGEVSKSVQWNQPKTHPILAKCSKSSFKYNLYRRKYA
jgi:hypothetical protein